MDKYFEANAVLSMFAKNYMELKKELPIRPSEMGVLNIITNTQGPHTPAMLAELLGVSKPMITAHITVLKGNGYVEKEMSSSDKRAYYVLPTKKAIALVERAKKDMDKSIERFITAMGREEFNTFLRLASVANKIMEKQGE